MAKQKLTEEGFKAAAAILNVEIAAIKAVAKVEAPRGGFLEDDRVTILLERHKFYKYTGGAFAASHPQICSKKSGGYAKTTAGEYVRFSMAFRLNPKAAMLSTSWGKFQIMGFNFHAAGFNNVDEFVTAMKESEDAQLKAFVNVIKAWGLADELRRHDWSAFAAAYNGEGYKKNQYDTKMARAYKDAAKDGGGFEAKLINTPVVGHSVTEDLVDDSEPVEVHEEPEPVVTPPVEVAKTSPEAREEVTKIPAVPPFPVTVPSWAKKIVGYGAGINVLGLGGSFAFLRDNPAALEAVLNIAKWGLVGMAVVVALIVLGLFVMRMWNAKLANDLNMARLHNYGNPDTKNVDFSGWKVTANKEEVTF